MKLFFIARQPLVGQGFLVLWCFTITPNWTHCTRLDPLKERSARRRALYLTTNNTHTRHTSMPPEGFEPAIPASERPQTHALDRAAAEIGYEFREG